MHSFTLIPFEIGQKRLNTDEQMDEPLVRSQMQR